MIISNEGDSLLVHILAGFMCAIAGMGLIVYAFILPDAIGARVKADTINQALGTNYTAQQVFFARNELELMQYGNRTRINVELSERALERHIDGGVR